MKYCGGTFSGHKTILCAEEIVVVGHRCTYEGRLPETDRVGVIIRRPACKNVTDVRMFFGMIRVCCVFIQDFARLAGPLNKLLRKSKVFEWGPSQEKSMNDLKTALLRAVPLENIDYESDGAVVLAVDTSYMAVGFYIYQEDSRDKKKKKFIKFGSITLNDRKARFSQPKGELFRLKHALEASKYLLIGCRKLIIETDAKYIYGMLNHLEMSSNAIINWWIEKILMFHFKLRHVAGKCFGLNGLSRQEKQDGDKEYPPDEDHMEVKGPPKFSMTEDAEPPLPFEDFKKRSDERGGFYMHLATKVEDFQVEEKQARERSQFEYEVLKDYVKGLPMGVEGIAQFTLGNLLPEESGAADILDYDEKHRTKEGLLQDERLPIIRDWLLNPTE